MIEQIFQLDDLNALAKFLNTFDNQDELREQLFEQFLNYADYKNAQDWNKAVRLCESLAIVGWGKYEPLEAVRGKYYNGNPKTFFVDRFGQRHFVEAIWSKRKLGLTMEVGRTSYFKSSNQKSNQQTVLSDYPTVECVQDIKLTTQQNWIPKAPIFVTQFIVNCYPNSDFLADELKTIQQLINSKMNSSEYGKVINFIGFILHFSYPSREQNGIFSYCQCNYIINDEIKDRDESRQFLQSKFSEDEIREFDYFAVNRFKYGGFRKKTGRMDVDIYFEKEFSELNHQAQKETLADYLLTAVKTIAKKYQKLDYRFDLMIADFENVLQMWLK